MKKEPLNKRIKTYLQNQSGWISGKEIEQRSYQAGYKASYGAREARKLAEIGEIQRKEEKGTVWYAHKKVKKTRKEYQKYTRPDGSVAMREVEIEYVA